jgi:hypothetical protein
MKIHAPDLTKQQPRSPRIRLGGYAILPRMIDKGRASIIGKAGEYHFNCPLDKHFLTFAGIDAIQLKKQLALGKGDGEILVWINAHAKKKRSTVEITAWSAWQDNRVPTDVESRDYLNKLQSKTAPKRTDIGSWFDFLDVDDFVTFGGKA